MAAEFEIDTPRLHLRPIDSTDLTELHNLWTDADVRRYLWDDVVITVEQARDVIIASAELFERRGFGFWALRPASASKIIGFCGLRLFDQQDVELLYGLYPEFWGQGLATEAGHAVLSFGFAAANLHRIYAGADPPNAASFRVMKRLGMNFARRIRANGPIAIYYSIDRSDFRFSLL